MSLQVHIHFARAQSLEAAVFQFADSDRLCSLGLRESWEDLGLAALEVALSVYVMMIDDRESY